MPTTRLRAVVALAFAAGVASLSACGGDSGGGPSFPDSVSTADALDAASNSVSFTDDMLGLLDFGSPGLAAPSMVTSRLLAIGAAHGTMLQAPRAPLGFDLTSPAMMGAAIQRAAAEGCTVTSHGTYDIGFGTPVDVNANGIPDNMGIRIECVQTDSTNPDTTFTSHVIEDISIVERMGDLFGYDESVYVLEREGDSFGNFGQESQRVTIHTSINAGAANSSLGVTVAEDQKQDTASLHAELGQSWAANFDPAGTITLGDPLPDGALSFTGRTYILDPTATSWNFTLATTTPLAYDASCAAGASNPPFTGGVIAGHLNGNGSSAGFTATFTACGVDPTVATSGTFAAPPLAVR